MGFGMFKDDTGLTETLRDARDRLEKHRDEGMHCPCCGQFAKRYRRKLNSGMAVQLLTMYRMVNSAECDQDDFIHARRLVCGKAGAGDLSKLRYWGLIESRGDAGEETRSAGYWRLTDTGVMFARGLLRVRQYACIYGNAVEKLDGDLITIQQALGNKFNYNELMGD